MTNRAVRGAVPAALILAGLAITARIALPQAVSNPANPTNNPNQINVTTGYLYLNKLHYAGTWSGTVTYNSQDVVFYSGASYVSLQAANLDQNPASAALYWIAIPSSGGGGGAGVTYCSATGGASNALTCTPSPALAAYGAGVTLSIKVDDCNTGAETVNVSGLGTRAIYSSGAVLAANALCPSSGTNQPFLLTDDGARFNIVAGGGSGGGGNGALSPPTFSVPAGSYTVAQNIVISGPGGATICYTVDGTNPTATTPGTCLHGATYSSALFVPSTITLNAIATEAAWTNSTVAGATYTINYPTYSDSFVRADGDLGADWAEPNGASASLQIISDLVYAASAPTNHAFEVYQAGSFANNQWTLLTVSSGVGDATTDSGQGAIVRGDPNGSGFYNDAVQVGSGMGGLGSYRIGNAGSSDFCASPQQGTPYAVGDTHMLAVAGSNPVFFWSLHGVGSAGVPTMDATCFDVANLITGGEAGFGDLDGNMSPTVATGAWQGGSLPSFSATPTDNFQRANAGWLGVNWWFPEANPSSGSQLSFMRLANNSAVITPTGSVAVAIWTTPFTAGMSSVVTVGALASGDWIGAVARYSLATNGDTFDDESYMAFDLGGVIYLYEDESGVFTLLDNLGSYGGGVSTIELDATGTSPVALVVKINGTQFGSTYLDSAYLLTGTYAGFTMYNSATSKVTGWTGADIP